MVDAVDVPGAVLSAAADHDLLVIGTHGRAPDGRPAAGRLESVAVLPGRLRRAGRGGPGAPGRPLPGARAGFARRAAARTQGRALGRARASSGSPAGTAASSVVAAPRRPGRSRGLAGEVGHVAPGRGGGRCPRGRHALGGSAEPSASCTEAPCSVLVGQAGLTVRRGGAPPHRADRAPTGCRGAAGPQAAGGLRRGAVHQRHDGGCSPERPPSALAFGEGREAALIAGHRAGQRRPRGYVQEGPGRSRPPARLRAGSSAATPGWSATGRATVVGRARPSSGATWCGRDERSLPADLRLDETLATRRAGRGRAADAAIQHGRREGDAAAREPPEASAGAAALVRLHGDAPGARQRVAGRSCPRARRHGGRGRRRRSGRRRARRPRPPSASRAGRRPRGRPRPLRERPVGAPALQRPVGADDRQEIEHAVASRQERRLADRLAVAGSPPTPHRIEANAGGAGGGAMAGCVFNATPAGAVAPRPASGARARPGAAG